MAEHGEVRHSKQKKVAFTKTGGMLWNGILRKIPLHLSGLKYNVYINSVVRDVHKALTSEGLVDHAQGLPMYRMHQGSTEEQNAC